MRVASCAHTRKPRELQSGTARVRGKRPEGADMLTAKHKRNLGLGCRRFGLLKRNKRRRDESVVTRHACCIFHSPKMVGGGAASGHLRVISES